MTGLVLDLLFNLLVERGVLELGARAICAVRPGGRGLTEQMERSGPNLAAGAALWSAAVVMLMIVL
jgi:hypothetical protein